MSDTAARQGTLFEVAVWDRSTRIFHAVNALCVLLLACFGLLILNASLFGIGDAGKILLKTLHVYTGYVFAVNLLWRFAWAFFGGRFARWRSLLPFGRGYRHELFRYVRGLVTGRIPVYAGHNPLGRLMVTLLLLLLLVQAVTGLVLAGTDLYKPPFGGMVAEWVTGGDTDKLARLTPGSRDFVEPAAYDQMRAFRAPIVAVHKYAFYVLLVAIVLHVAGVVFTELVERNSLISAMVSGRKVMSGPPVDQDRR